MAGLAPAIHVRPPPPRKTWMPGSSPGMTAEGARHRIRTPAGRPAPIAHTPKDLDVRSRGYTCFPARPAARSRADDPGLGAGLPPGVGRRLGLRHPADVTDRAAARHRRDLHSIHPRHAAAAAAVLHLLRDAL